VVLAVSHPESFFLKYGTYGFRVLPKDKNAIDLLPPTDKYEF